MGGLVNTEKLQGVSCHPKARTYTCLEEPSHNFAENNRV